MTNWLKSSLDSIFGLVADSSDAPSTASLKRKAFADSPRHSSDSYRSALYGVSSPSGPRRVRRRLPTTKAKESIERLKDGVRRNSTSIRLIDNLQEQALQGSVKEPEYALRDVEIRDGMWQIMNQIEKLATEWFGSISSQSRGGRLSADFFKQFTVESAKIIGCVASGGPGGVQDWHDLFLCEPQRCALVAAIIGNVLVEQVFQHIFFGGSATGIDAMMDLQRRYRTEDGFDRNRHYATYLRSVLDPTCSKICTLPSNFANHVNHIVSVLYSHLKPIIGLSAWRRPDELIPALYPIVVQAGLLSLSMRLDPRTVYYFEPVFKGDSFSGKRMECINEKQMSQQNPRILDDEPALTAAEQDRRSKLSEAEKERVKGDKPLTQITLMDGITAYRLGGWEVASSTTEHPTFEKPEWAKTGVRARKLTKGWVYCRWGRPRRFKDGKPDDVPAAHGVAWKGGFKEFTDVEGVMDWLRLEREESAKAKALVEKEVTKENEMQTVSAGAAKFTLKVSVSSPKTPNVTDELSEMDLQSQLEAETRTSESSSASPSTSDSDSVSSMDFEP